MGLLQRRNADRARGQSDAYDQGDEPRINKISMVQQSFDFLIFYSSFAPSAARAASRRKLSRPFAGQTLSTGIKRPTARASATRLVSFAALQDDHGAEFRISKIRIKKIRMFQQCLDF
jgi:hypothetical protein